MSKSKAASAISHTVADPGYLHEQWAAVKRFPSYEVSNFGRVRNKITGKILKQYENQGSFHKYLKVKLYGPGERRNCYVHRLVAQAFCDRRHYTKSQVHHKDRDTFNNQHTNLAWATPLEHHPAYAGELPF